MVPQHECFTQEWEKKGPENRGPFVTPTSSPQRPTGPLAIWDDGVDGTDKTGGIPRSAGLPIDA